MTGYEIFDLATNALFGVAGLTLVYTLVWFHVYLVVLFIEKSKGRR